MLQLRVYGEPTSMAAAADDLAGLAGARHVGVSADATGTRTLVRADLRAEAADEALARLEQLGVPAADVELVRLETIGPSASDEPLVLVWADVLAQARARARAPVRYLVLMAVAGLIAAFGVINGSAILVVGAMATSPDLLPVTAACTGIVLRRRRLALRGVGTLALGLGIVWLSAVVVAALLDAFDLLPSGFTIGEIPAAQTHVNATTILVALAAGVAGMLAVETRASAAVGVAISVTTIPASAYLGVAFGTGQLDHAWSGVSVLAANVAMMLLGGSVTLAIQRAHVRRAAGGS